MSTERTQYGFVSGELSVKLSSREDFDRYNLAVEEAMNFFVDYQGGLTRRPGLQFREPILEYWSESCFIPFRYGPSAGQSLVLHLTKDSGTMRIFKQGAYVTDLTKACTSLVQNGDGTYSVQSAGHGLVGGEYIKLDMLTAGAGIATELHNQIFYVSFVSGLQFKLKTIDESHPYFTVSSAYLTGALGAFSFYFSRIYSFNPHGLDGIDLRTVKSKQSRDTIVLTSSEAQPLLLTRNTDSDWDYATLQNTLGTGVSSPGQPTLTPSAAGTAGVAFCVTAVDAAGIESAASPYAFHALSVNYPSAGGSMKVTWPAVTGARYYKVYRSQVLPVGTEINRAVEMGFVGISYGPFFTDNNIVPDFTIKPPYRLDPFTKELCSFVDVTAGGAGYTNASAVTITNAVLPNPVNPKVYPVVVGGAIVAVVVEQPFDCRTPTITFSVGAGATFNVDPSYVSVDIFPACAELFQQRLVLAGAPAAPLQLNMSRTGYYYNFDSALIAQDDDALEFTIAADTAAPINWMTTTRTGLLLWTEAGVWEVTGDTQNVVTPNSINATLQNFSSCHAYVGPLRIGPDYLFLEARGNIVRLLTYVDSSKGLEAQDMSILASHLLDSTNQIVHWDYLNDPHKIVLAPRDDGTALALTIVKEQNIAGWARMATRGKIEDVCVISEGTVDTAYFIVSRYFGNGVWGKTLETMANAQSYGAETTARPTKELMDAWYLDCGLALGRTFPDADIIIPEAAYADTITITATAGVFSVDQVGNTLVAGGGRYVITAYTSSTSVDAVCHHELDEESLIHELGEARIESGDWQIGEPVSSVSGLLLFAGMTFSVYADGQYLGEKTVNSIGKIDLGGSYSFVLAGLKYRSWIKTLAPVLGDGMQGRLRRVALADLRVYNTRSISVGPTLDDMYPIKLRGTEPLGEPLDAKTGLYTAILDNSYDYLGQFYISVSDPVPATILSINKNIEVGDAAGD